MYRLLISFVLLFLSACSTTGVGLHYTPSAALPQPSTTIAAVTVGSFVDQRGESATWLGAIRGGYGNAIKKLESERPVAELVKAAFSDGLRARGIPVNEDTAKTQITGIIKKLDCSQYVRREAHVDIEITVLDKSGRQRFTRKYTASNVDGSLLSFDVGVFASVEDLRAIMEKTLHEAVDQALDDSTLRAALRNEEPSVLQASTPPAITDVSATEAQLRNLDSEFRAGRISIDEYRQMKKVLQAP
jgi:uncharacterized lipoprotein YajG